MLIERRALNAELSAINDLGTVELCELLASLGFPVDAVEERDGQVVLDVDVTANRGDALSHRGLARDLAARLDAVQAPIPRQILPEGAMLFPVRLEAAACPLYATAIMELGLNTGTPAEVVSFLASMGSNAKQLPAVDASNELLHRYGHPTHAFDADTVKGALIVRWAMAGESLVTLDGVERKLTSADLLIADEGGPIALAGVMGGEVTKVTAATRHVILESAYFDPRVVRRMAHRHGLHSDASYRFGRGVDPAMAPIARDLLAARLQAWAGATLKGAWTAGALPSPSAAIFLAGPTLDRIAGEGIHMEEAALLLGRLGCAMQRDVSTLGVVPPTWRHDLLIEEDLAEEVLRMRGFERIGSALPPLEGPPHPLSPGYLQGRDLARRLAHAGFHQTVTLGFMSPEADAAFAKVDNPAAGRTLGNPLGQEYSVMRASLLASLKATGELNLRQGAKEVKLFEIAPVYQSTPEGPAERQVLAIVWAGSMGGDNYLTKARPVQAADLLGVAQDLGAEGLQEVQQLAEGMLALEIPLSLLPAHAERIIPVFKPFRRYPVVERDLSLLVDLGQSYRSLEMAMSSAAVEVAGEAFLGLGCVDVFRHKSLPAGRQAWLVRLRFQASNRTLTSEEVDGWLDVVLRGAKALGAELRG
jgi:phenylalanyl-tRNA synthetase beta chain